MHHPRRQRQKGRIGLGEMGGGAGNGQRHRLTGAVAHHHRQPEGAVGRLAFAGKDVVAEELKAAAQRHIQVCFGMGFALARKGGQQDS